MMKPVDKDIAEMCARIVVEPGDLLYIQLPQNISAEKAEATAKAIHNFFKPERVRVLFGDIPITFSAVHEEKGAA